MLAPAGPVAPARPSVPGLMSQLYAISSKLWGRAVVSVSRLFGEYVSAQGSDAKLDADRLHLFNREDAGNLDSALSLSTQMQLAQLRMDLQNLEHIQGLVNDELAEPLTEPHPIPLSPQDNVLRERIRRGIWNLEGLRSAIDFVDEDLAEIIDRLIGPAPAAPVSNPEEWTMRASMLVLRSLRCKIRTLKAEILRLETLNPRSADAFLRAPRERRVRFQD